MGVCAGGGRRVIRCEVSLDGEMWRRAEIERHETPTPANKTWCWVFWSVAVSAVELLRAPQLRVRAVDSSQNMMPEKCAPRPARGAQFSAVGSPCVVGLRVTGARRGEVFGMEASKIWDGPVTRVELVGKPSCV